MTSVFLDTVGLIALWDENDQWHELAELAVGEIESAGHSVITTTFILLECGNAMSRTPFRANVMSLRDTMEAQGSLIVPTPDDWDSAWAAYGRGEADRAGIVDHVSFAVMRRLGLSDAFTNDRHFRAAGFTPLF